MAGLVDIYFALCQIENISPIYDIRRCPPRPGGKKTACFLIVMATHRRHVDTSASSPFIVTIL